MTEYGEYEVQLPPKPGKDDVTKQVIKDIEARAALGVQKYGTRLQTFNGRDALKDLYEELLDAAQYVKQRLMELETLQQYFDERVKARAEKTEGDK